ncbi:MAG: 30S ribosomal protein S6 [Planctomycetia bacterium]|nr:30S ribosomal protein S6 [Planctomycetia bacterium]
MKQINVYEGLFIFDSASYANNPDGVSGQIAKTIEDHDGVVRVSRLYKEGKLAYPIKKQKTGVYWLVYFRMPTDQLLDFNRQIQLNNNVLRHLVIKIDPRLEEALVNNAQVGPTVAEEQSTEKPQVAVDDVF